MANTILTATAVTREALRVLHQKLNFVGTITRDYDDRFAQSGAKIGDTLKFQPTYYQKSDGYREYLPEVNKITDPAAQQEMIRGGKEAYKYIIAVSNEAVFQSKVAQK